MENDYRRTAYEKRGGDFRINKIVVEQNIRIKHPRMRDLHELLRQNDSQYKQSFIKAYDGKCAYCGISISIIGEKQFEIDHFIPHTDRKRFKTKPDAGYMENLVLSCYDCNRSKDNYSVSDQFLSELHPDGEGIIKCFFRDDNYYIQVNPDRKYEKDIVEFYNQLHLGQEIHRLDYLLMALRGLSQKHKGNNEISGILAKAFMLLLEKRNIAIGKSK